jgi:hypothetical protein
VIAPAAVRGTVPTNTFAAVSNARAKSQNLSPATLTPGRRPSHSGILFPFWGLWPDLPGKNHFRWRTFARISLSIRYAESFAALTERRWQSKLAGMRIAITLDVETPKGEDVTIADAIYGIDPSTRQLLKEKFLGKPPELPTALDLYAACCTSIQASLTPGA